MANAPHDDNFIRGRMGVLNTDGVTTIPIALDETTGAMKVNMVDTLGVGITLQPLSPKDENYYKCMMFVGTDGLTYPFVCDSEGKVLIDN